jgi:hypothetical protein
MGDKTMYKLLDLEVVILLIAMDYGLLRMLLEETSNLDTFPARRFWPRNDLFRLHYIKS